MDTPTPSPLSLRKDHIDTHPSLEQLVKYLVKKVNGKKVKPSRIRDLFESTAHYKLFIHAVSSRYVDEICVSKHYMIIQRRHPEAPIGHYLATYLVGVNVETNKLFVFRNVPKPPFGELLFTANRLSVFKCDEQVVKEFVFRVDLDMDLDPEELIKQKLDEPKRNLNIRVQGDIVLTLTDMPLGEYKDLLKRQLSQTIAREVALHIANKIVGILADNHLSSRIVEPRNRGWATTEMVRVFIPTPFYSFERDDYTKVAKIMFKLAKIVASKLNIDDVTEYLGLGEVDVRGVYHVGSSQYAPYIEIIMASHGHQIVSVKPRRFMDGFGFDVDVSIQTMYQSPRVGELTEKIMSEIEPQPMSTNFMRHRITIEETLPTQITAKIDVLGRQRLFTFNMPLVGRGSIVFAHPEHKTKILFLNDFTQIDLSSIVNDDTIERLNMFALKTLDVSDVSIDEYTLTLDDDDDDDFEDEFEDYEEWDEDDDEN